MPLFRKASILVKLTSAFALLLLLMAGIGGFAVNGVTQLWRMTSDLYEHPFTVNTEVLLANRQFSAINRALLRGVVAGRDAAEIEAAIDQIAEIEADMAAHLAKARPRYLGDPMDFERLNAALADWRQVRGRIIALSRRGQRQEAETTLITGGKTVDEEAVRAFGKIIDFASDRARRFEEEASREQAEIKAGLIVAVVILILLGGATAVLVTRAIVGPLDVLRRRMVELAEGNLDVALPTDSAGRELDAMNAAVRVFKQATRQLNDRSWVKTQVTELAAALATAETPAEFALSLAGGMAPLVGAGCVAFHLWRSDENRFVLVGGYGLGEGTLGRTTSSNEGLVGQCARARAAILVTDLPENYLRISSGLGEAPPRLVLVTPLIGKDTLLAVLEFAAFRPFSESQRALVEEALPVVALSLEVLIRNLRTRELLEESQCQAEELQSSEEELRSQAEELRASEEELRAQREELQATNEELIEKSSALESARHRAEAQVLELGLANRYKSEFLANMSHELRTPLNSVLILAKDLADNGQGNLDADQVDSARIIHESGSHLLHLINDVLDLSKVEAGKMAVAAETIPLEDFAISIRRRFIRLAEAKGLSLTVETNADLPAAILGDRPKLDQIINNLVGNAIKFTHQGGVTVRFDRGAEAEGDWLELAVIDSGIGVPADKIDHIFAAFEQADGTTSRQFGGTGLGLTISARLAELMGGGVRVRSIPGSGSTFTLRLPLLLATEAELAKPAPPPAAADDRHRLTAGGDVILVIEDDDTFAEVLCTMARRRGFKALRAADGVAGIDLAIRYRPTGILLDVGLPGKDGWQVVADLKSNPATSAIPVHFITAISDRRQGMRLGAASFLTKPVDRDQIDAVLDQFHPIQSLGIRRVLIVDDDPGARKATALLVHGDQVEIVEAHSGEQALGLLESGHFDCLVLDLMLPDISGFDLLDRAAARRIDLPPVVVYSGKDLTDDENLRLRQYTDSIVIKGVRSPERLVDEVGLFLHSVQAARAPEEPPPRATTEAGLLDGRSVLVVDDDMRNAFALSKVLRGAGLVVLLAQDGHKALAQLSENPSIDLVLMDMMMPGMDGLATIREIRKQASFKALPIIALTAKAMPGDRENCLAGGANDYLTKPVDTDRLLAVMADLLTVTP